MKNKKLMIPLMSMKTTKIGMMMRIGKMSATFAVTFQEKILSRIVDVLCNIDHNLADIRSELKGIKKAVKEIP